MHCFSQVGFEHFHPVSQLDSSSQFRSGEIGSCAHERLGPRHFGSSGRWQQIRGHNFVQSRFKNFWMMVKPVPSHTFRRRLSAEFPPVGTRSFLALDREVLWEPNGNAHPGPD